jgi:hypothetical protein
VNSQSARECRLSDQSATLCDRAAYAKQRSDDSEWWRDQLASASITGIGKVQFVVLAMQQFMPLEPMLALSEEISGALDRLSDSAWHQLARAISSLEVPTRSLGGLGLPPYKSPRMAALLIDRLSRNDGLLIYEQYLANYNGKDRYVLQKCSDLAFRALWKKDMQDQSIQVI